MDVPSWLGWWRSVPGGPEWLAALPRLAAECAENWQLRLGAPLPGGNVSLVLEAVRADGSPAVLKLNFPQPESQHETDALELWDGAGAVALYARDDQRRALLIERCLPGSALWEIERERDAYTIAGRVLRRLWRPAPAGSPFRALSGEAWRWAEELPAEWERLGGPFERRLIDLAVSAVHDLVPSQGRAVIVHQDLHGGNILRAEREPWLAIDPKPLIGEPAFDAASLLRDRRRELRRDPAPGRRIRRRLDQLSSELDLDRERVRGWGIVHALAWGISGQTAKVEADMVACARWLADA
ncbi:MAG TPA: aminoglycoside phosphotransferase family protein [Solirubrobacteraceae bacterium]|nr:aminoglycoside phosphotransferase family protein [Solirubrobacteraceae bacterium]